jgi:hypothetical protein
MNKIQDLDLKKFKRFFAFGCSFTSYSWPTWADIMSAEIPHAEFFNCGHAGGGNLLITSRIAEADAKYKFDQDDLIIVMWTTFCREDRWINGTWMSVGNIYTQKEYSDEFVKKYADTKGYLLRDLSLIHMTSKYSTTLNSTFITLASVPYDFQQEENDPFVINLLDLYKDTIQLTPLDLLTSEFNGNWEYGHNYYDPNMGGMFKDYHPSPVRYYNYLNKTGFPLSDKSRIYAIEANNIMQKIKHVDDFHVYFEKINKEEKKLL